MKRQNPKKEYVVCTDNSGYEVSLERGKIYEVLPDVEGKHHGYLRIVDESGEDYIFDSDRFSSIKIPQSLQKALGTAPKEESKSRRPIRGHV